MPEKTRSNIFPVRLAQILLGLNAAIWLIFGSLSWQRLADKNPDQVIPLGIIALLMFGNVGAMILAAFGLGKRRQAAYFFALAVLFINIVLTFTDQFGLFDLLTLLIDLIILAVLIGKKQSFY